jgi:inward rectifier potassium channel
MEDAMRKPTFDPGLTQQYRHSLRRAINPDGSFNVIRRGASWRDVHPYLHLVNMSWPAYLGTVFVAYMIVNVAFAVVYFALGPDALVSASEPTTGPERFFTCLYFSAQTLTTVGFGSIAPLTMSANFVAALEALMGLLSFAVATGVFFGRVSRPSARIGFSPRALIAPYQDGTALEFRIVNRRANALMELEASLILMTVERTDRGPQRSYARLKLERDAVDFFPLTWTIVHPIDNESPFAGKSPEDFRELEAEILVKIKGWDETFSQTVHQRYSYRHDEIVWNARYTPAFGIDDRGDMVLNIEAVGDYEISSPTGGELRSGSERSS